MWKNKSARVIPLLFTPPLLSSLPVIGIPADPLLIFHCIRSDQRFYLSTRSNDVTPWRCFHGIVRRNTRLRRQRDAKADSRNGRSIRRKRESELRLNARRKKERERVYCILSVALLNVAEGFLTQTTRFSWLILTSTRSWSGSGCSFVSVGVP